MSAVSTPPLVSLKNILVASDFSACSRIALLYAAALARQQKGKIFLAHVEPYEPLSPIPMDAAPVFTVPAAKDPRFLMKQAMVTPELAGIEHEMLLQQGNFWPVLEAMIEEHDIELVIIGTHGREGLKKLVLGSVAEEVFRRAACPVITVGPHVSVECLHQGRLRRLLFATDLSVASLHALPLLSMLAERHQAPVTFLHVLASAVPLASSNTTFLNKEVEEARDRLSAVIPEGMRAEAVVEVGLPAEIIVSLAQEQHASLIVMGLHSQSVFAATHLPWTTAHRVVCDAHCPVLTVR